MTDEQKLTQLRSRYDTLLNGKAVSEIQRDGRKIVYQPQDAKLLKAEIDRLEASLASANSTYSRRRAPAGV